MERLAGYRLQERLHLGKRFATWRAEREVDGLPVVLKAALDARVPQDAANLRHEFSVSSELDVPGVVRAQGLEESEDSGVVLVMEDFGGQSLKHYQRGEPMDPGLVVKIGAQVARLLGDIHSRGVIHKDIKPSNLIVHPQTLEVRLTDFGISSQLPREISRRRAPRRLEGTLAYIAPEQTGRMNRHVDARSDLYSLGATLYELLTGRPPFESKDPIELVHAHIARAPVRVDELRPDVPPPLVAVVHKLLSKAAEDRYQSAFGLLHDLERLLEDPTVDLVLGERDVPAVLRLPEGLVGREAERTVVMDAVQRALDGGREALMITGPGGIGKSALVAEVERALAARKGALVSGKFEQFQRGVPYRALVGALSQLADRLLTGSDEDVARWRRRLLDAVSPNGSVIADLVPRFTPLLGDTQPAPELGPAEADIRTRVVARAFLRALCRADHPVILFLDDLQWADDASLDALKLLLNDHELSHILILGAYRDREVDESHPLRSVLSDLERSGAKVGSLTLEPLSADHVTQLLAATCNRPVDEVGELSELVHAKTGGNPFFVRQFVSELYRRGLIDFDSGSGRWTWDIEGARSQRLTDNVVELLSARLGELPESSVEALAAAGCLGSEFPLDLLARVIRKPIEAVARDLMPAVREDLVVPLSAEWKYAELLGETEVRFAFLHDRVQQAAIETLTEDARIEVHLAAGRLLRDADADLFAFVEHLNIASERLGKAEQTELAELDLRAARRALQSNAAGPALDLARKGLSLLDGSSGAETARALQRAEVESLFRTGALDEMDARIDQLLGTDLPDLDQVALLEMRIAGCVSRLDHLGSLEAGFQALDVLGESLPRNPGKLHVITGLIAAKFALRNTDPTQLDQLPELTDAKTRAAMRVMRLMTSGAFFASPDLFPLIVFRLVRISVDKGVCPPSAYGFAAYGLLMVAALSDYAAGIAWGDLAVRTVNRLEADHLAGPVHLLHQIFIRHWTHPLQECIEPLQESAHTALGAGDLEYFSYNLYWNLNHRLWVGQPLHAIEEDLARWWSGMRKYKQDKGMLLLHQRHLIDVLRAGPPADLPEDQSDEELLQRWEAAKDSHGIPAAHGFMAMQRFYWHDFDEAARLFGIATGTWSESLVGLSMLVVFRFHEGLSILRSGSPDLRKAAKIAKELDGWATHCPANVAHKAALVHAEIGRVSGKPLDQVLPRYEAAIAGASKHGYVNDEALANELLGRFQAERNAIASAAHLLEARRLYAIWGATAVVDRLDSEYPDLKARRLLGGTWSSTGSESSDSTRVDRIDLAQIVTANQTLSEALVLDNVLSTLLRLTMQNAGAQRGVLLLKQEDGLRIEAEASEADDVSVHTADLNEASLPQSLLNFVLRTGGEVVLGDAHRQGVHTEDPYIRDNRIRSLLCTPLQHRGQLLGVVYLENNLVPDAFTPERLETVKLLAGQAGISIRNAQLLSRLENALADQVALTTAHSRFVPHQFLQSLNRNRITEVQLGDHVQKEMSIFFSDIRGFTPLIESMPTGEALLDFINTYLSYAEPPLLQHNGFIDSYNGDGIMALFDDPGNAIRGAIGMQRALDRYNEERTARGDRPVNTGIGISTGRIMMGTIGGRERIKCGVIGDTVNTSARVESLTKKYGVRVLVTEHTLDRVADRGSLTFRRVDRICVVGKIQPVTLYQVIDAEPGPIRERLGPKLLDYEEALERYYSRDFDAALAKLYAFLSSAPDDVPAGLFAERCRKWSKEGVPADWDGVEYSATK